MLLLYDLVVIHSPATPLAQDARKPNPERRHRHRRKMGPKVEDPIVGYTGRPTGDNRCWSWQAGTAVLQGSQTIQVVESRQSW